MFAGKQGQAQWAAERPLRGQEQLDGEIQMSLQLGFEGFRVPALFPGTG